MVVVAVLGLLVNIAAFTLLHGADRENLNVRGAAIHVLGDMLGSVAALVAGGVILSPAGRRSTPALDPCRRHHRAERLARGERCRAHTARRRAGGARYAGNRPRPHRKRQRRGGRAPRACLVDHPEPAHGDPACRDLRERDPDQMVRNIKARLKERASASTMPPSKSSGELAPTPHPPKPSAEMSETKQHPDFGRGVVGRFPRRRGNVTHAVRNVSFDIGKAETVALVGESGSGKTVTALSILRLLPYPAASHPSGRIRFEGEDLLTLDRPAPRPRQQDLDDLPRAYDLAQPAAHHRAAGGRGAEDSPRHVGQARAARVLDLLDKVGIDDPKGRLESYPHQLSGGQRQRVMIAMALANEPDLSSPTSRRPRST